MKINLKKPPLSKQALNKHGVIQKALALILAATGFALTLATSNNSVVLRIIIPLALIIIALYLTLRSLEFVTDAKYMGFMAEPAENLPPHITKYLLEVKAQGRPLREVEAKIIRNELQSHLDKEKCLQWVKRVTS